jgi:hypothetical protein
MLPPLQKAQGWTTREVQNLSAYVEEGAVAGEGGEMVGIGAQADVIVGADDEQGDAVDAEKFGGGGIEAGHARRQLAMISSGDGGFENRRSFGGFLQPGVQCSEGRGIRAGPGEKHQRVSGAMRQMMQPAGARVRRLHRENIR